MNFGQSDVAGLRVVLLKHAREAFVSDGVIERQWRALNYRERPDFDRSVEEYDQFAAALEGSGVELRFLPADGRVGLDSIYTRDVSVVCDKGIILASMGKEARRQEPSSHRVFFEEAGLPILGAIAGDGRLEGGDAVWLDERTLAVGRGRRTNEEGIRQLRDLLADAIDELITVPLPDVRAPGGVFHLMSILSPLDRDLALVYPPLAPPVLLRVLGERGIAQVEVPQEEFESMGGNVLALAPRVALMLAGNPETRRRLERAGVEVREYAGREISLKGCGGPTCLTRPLARGV